MSQAPHVTHLRNGQKMGDLQLIDIMIKDERAPLVNPDAVRRLIERSASARCEPG